MSCPAQTQSARGSPKWPQRQGLQAATRVKRAGKVSRARARATVTLPSSSGWRSASSASRRNSGSSSRNRTPACARLISPGLGMEPPPISPDDETPAWGLLNGRVQISRSAPRAPAESEWIFVTVIASASVSGGRMPGRRRASIVLPVPGGPTKRTLWPPAAAISSARLAVSCPLTSEKSGSAPLKARSGGIGVAGAIVRSPVRCSIASRKWPTGITRVPASEAAWRLFAAGSSSSRTPSLPAQFRDRQGAADGAHLAVEPEFAAGHPALEGLGGEFAVGGQKTQGDRQVELVAFLAQVRRRQVDDDVAALEVVAAAANRRPHAVAALAHRGVRQSDQLHRRQAEVGRHFHLDFPRFDAPGRRGVHVRDHTD